jgi:hypothetical protein
MGRGRAKAKQTKVARQLKYSDGGTDLDALRRELVSGAPSDVRGPIAGESSDSGEISDLTDLDDEDDDTDDLDHRDFG